MLFRSESENGRRWINTGHSTDFVWLQVNQLLRQLGLEVDTSSPEAGLIETKWAENQADVPDGFIRGLIKRVASNLFGASSRDKFKIRLERSGDRVLVFVTHYAMKDEATGNRGYRSCEKLDRRHGDRHRRKLLPED